MREVWSGQRFSLLRWAVTAIGVTAVLMVVLTLIVRPVGSIESLPNPLAPPDTESPRATLMSFKSELAAAEKLIVETYKTHVNEPGWFMKSRSPAFIACGCLRNAVGTPASIARFWAALPGLAASTLISILPS